MSTQRHSVSDSRAFTFKGFPVVCYRNKYGNAPIAWMIKTNGEWSTWPMKKSSIRAIIAMIEAKA